MSVEETLAHVELFSELEKDDLERLAKVTVSRDFEAGDVIVREGELGVAFYTIAKGKVEVVRGLGTGNEQVLATMGEGDFFGEMALFDNEVRSASVRAAEPTECLVLTKWDFNAELTTSPTITHAMFRILARRIREANAEAVTH
ncbi:MAG: Crp/Fnr family transcriptional regulator [Dehalococcoidia bacterium]